MPATPEEIAVAEFARTFGASATAIARAPAGSSSSATTPTTTAASSSPPPSTG